MDLHDEVLSVSEANPLWSMYLCIAEVVKGKNLTKDVVSKLFKLMPKEDFVGTEKDALIDFLVKLSSKKVSE